jgi:meiotically up-regulated gene 157 (Mug157) protein
MEKIVETTRHEQQSTAEDGPNPAFTFGRRGEEYPIPSAPAYRCGLSKCGFRPSDDRTEYPFLVSANAMAAVEFDHMAGMANRLGTQRARTLASAASQLSSQIRTGIEQFGKVQYQGRTVFAMEVDGRSRALTAIDDSNVPSLLSLPYLGFVPKSDPVYKATRALLLSPANKYYYVGTYASGIGSPHTPVNYIWPMAITMQALTSEDDTEIAKCLSELATTHATKYFMHESFHKDNPTQFTRPWFSWANALFGELILTLARERPHLIF